MFIEVVAVTCCEFEGSVALNEPVLCLLVNLGVAGILRALLLSVDELLLLELDEVDGRLLLDCALTLELLVWFCSLRRSWNCSSRYSSP